MATGGDVCVPPKHQNRLSYEKSPYLLQHAGNPVDWFPWGEEAFEKAKKEDRLIFLSVGYSTCHWCHVMERESFENEEIAKVMNEHFVNIKVDREERPDVDKVYMAFVQAVSGRGGWPMSVWLTPELTPVYGGTYFPPTDIYYGQPGFKKLLCIIASQAVPAEASEEVTENSGDGAEAAAPLSASSPTNKKEQKSGKTISLEDECLSQALNFLKRRLPDDYDTFGEYVAMELRSPSSETYRKMLKREIRQSIARIAELGDLNSQATRSTIITEALSPDP